MAVFASDTFTDANGTALGSHTPDVGSGWSGGNTANFDIQTNKAHADAGSGTYMAINGSTPASNEYDVQADIEYVATYNSGATPGVAGRWSGAWAGTGYRAYLYATVIYLEKVVSGSATQIGTYSPGDPGAATPITLKLEIRDAAKKVYVNGTERISSANNDVTQTGNPGISLRGTSGGSDWRVDDFSATDVAAGGTTAIYYMHQQTVAA